MIRYFCKELKKLEMGGYLRVDLGTEITYGDMESLSFSSSSTTGRVKGDSSKGADRWILATGVKPRIPPISGLDHPNVLSYVDILRRDVDVGDRVSIIEAGGVGFDAKKWM